MQAIVLVGGEGTRLRPLTESVPKPALTLVDRPFLAYIVEWLAGHGIEEVILACGFLADVLREALGEVERSGVRIRYVAEPEPLGTAGAIRFAADQMGDELGERFLALNGDVLTDFDLTPLLALHEKAGSRATLGLHAVEDASAYGLVRRDGDGDVLEFLEKTGEPVPGEISAGIYALERSVLELIPPGDAVSIERDVFPRLAGTGLHGTLLAGYWMDIGTPDRYLQATWDILEGRVETLVEPTGPGMYVDASAEFAESAVLGPRAVIGRRCRLESEVEVRESVLLEGCTAEAGSRIAGSILSAGARVSAGATLDGAVLGRDETVLSG
jgi:mannose-1-phosphate guanylyltransferase